MTGQVLNYSILLTQVIQNKSIELLLVAAGGGGASSAYTNVTGDNDSQGLVDSNNDHTNSILIPQSDIDAGRFK